MQTYGYSWDVFVRSRLGGSPTVRAYWPLIGRNNEYDYWSNVPNRHKTHEKRRVGKTQGSGPYWHHTSVKTLMPVAGDGTINVIAGTQFFECPYSPNVCFGYITKQNDEVVTCTVRPRSGTSDCSVSLYRYRPGTMNRCNFILTKQSYNPTVSEQYTKIPHTLEQAQMYFNRYSSQLASIKFSTIAKFIGVRDIASSDPSSAVQVDYTALESQPAPLDFDEDWLSISLIGHPIGRTAYFSQRAYEIAASDLPAADVNALANTMESARAIRSVILSDLTALLPSGKTFSKAMSGTWLAYRYAVCTTKFDVESYQDLIRRLQGMDGHQFISSHSVFVDTETGDIYRATLKFHVAGFDDDMSSMLSQLGFRLSLVNAWDMVPYSFIVDWFTHLSDLLELLDQKAASAELKPVEAWASRETGDHSTYIRWRTQWMPTIPLLQVRETSSKTLFMRIADAIALLATR